MEPRLIEKYRVGGDIKTLGAHETRWQFGNHEIRVLRRGNWQFYMNANSRISGWNGRSLADFPEWLDVRCPTMTDEQRWMLRHGCAGCSMRMETLLM